MSKRLKEVSKLKKLYYVKWIDENGAIIGSPVPDQNSFFYGSKAFADAHIIEVKKEYPKILAKYPNSTFEITNSVKKFYKCLDGTWSSLPQANIIKPSDSWFIKCYDFN